MLIRLKGNARREDMLGLRDWLTSMNCAVRETESTGERQILVQGDVYRLDTERLRLMPGVAQVIPTEAPYQRVSREASSRDSVISLGKVSIGGGHFCTIAGPCSVESEEQLLSVAWAIKAAGGDMLRGGAFKPRTSPYAFQGLGKEGVRLLVAVGRETGLPVVTEIMDISQLDCLAEVDMLQVGARSMQNYALLKALGRVDKPILLKRGLSATLDELLLSAEYIASGGNERIVLCERGIRTFSGDSRNTLDLSAVPLLREKTHLPVIVDPSHATGLRRLVKPMALAAAVVGADGVMVEVHNDPACALCDGQQAVSPEEFRELRRELGDILPHRCRTEYEALTLSQGG